MKPFGGTAVLPAGPVSLETLLQQANVGDLTLVDTTFTQLTVRAGTGNAGTTYFGTATLTNPPVLTAHGYIDAREAVGIPLYLTRIKTKDIYFAGTPGDTVYLALVQ